MRIAKVSAIATTSGEESAQRVSHIQIFRTLDAAYMTCYYIRAQDGHPLILTASGVQHIYKYPLAAFLQFLCHASTGVAFLLGNPRDPIGKGPRDYHASDWLALLRRFLPQSRHKVCPLFPPHRRPFSTHARRRSCCVIETHPCRTLLLSWPSRL
jgi:hypothetical protein